MKFSEFDLNIIGEIGNISVGGAATSLSNFVNKLVTISIPDAKIQNLTELKENFGSDVVYVKINYTNGLDGSNLLLMRKDEAVKFAQVVAKEKLNIELDDWGDLSREVLVEVFNIMVGNMSSAMSEIFNQNIKIDTPQMMENNSSELLNFIGEERFISIWFEMRIENSFKIKFLKILNDKQAAHMIALLREDHEL